MYISFNLAKSNSCLVIKVITTKSLVIFSFHLNPCSSSGQGILSSERSFQVGPTSHIGSKNQQNAIRSPDPENQRYDLIMGPRQEFAKILTVSDGDTNGLRVDFSDAVLMSVPFTYPIMVTARPLCLVGLVCHLYCPLVAT